MPYLFSVILRHWLPVALLNGVIMGVAAYNILTIQKSWTADAKLILPNTTRDLSLNLGEFGELQEGEGLIFSSQLDSKEILASIMTSTDAVRRAWELDPEHSLYPRLDVYKGLFDVEPDSDSTTISLVAEGKTPEVARERLGLFIEAFQRRLNELRADDVAQRNVLIEQELAEVEGNLDRAARSLVDFQEQTELVDSDEQTQELIETISALSLTQGQVVAEFQASSLRLDNLSNRLNQTPEQAILALQLSEDQGYQALEDKLSTLNVELLEAQTLFTNEHPQVAYLSAQRFNLIEEQRAYILQSTAGLPGVDTSVGEAFAALIQELVLAESETAALQQQALQLTTQLEQLNARLSRIPAAQVRLQALQREYDIAQEVYGSLIAQIEANRIYTFSTYPVVQVLDQPTANAIPSGPGRKPIAVGAFLAAVLGSAATLLFLESRNPLLTTADLQATSLLPLGKIPVFKKLRPGDFTLLASSLAFQQLATVVSKKLPTSETLMVGSAISGEGKTTVALGLALSLHQLGYRVLLVNGDICTDFPVDIQVSLPGGEDESDNSVSEFPSSITIMTYSGLEVATIQSKFLDKNGLSKFDAFEKLLHLTKSTQKYDYILIDSPSLSTSNDANWFATKISAMMLVIRPGISHRIPFKESFEQLTKTQAQVLGVVVNGTGAPS